MVAATEVGSIPRPDLLQAYEAHWLWFCTWGDTFINNEEYNPATVLQDVSFESGLLLIVANALRSWRLNMS